MPTVYFEGVEIECEEGALLRDVLVAAERAPYNSAAEYTNCGGNGICGTCAVRVEGEASEPTTRERVRRAAPPLRGKDVRLSCQTRVDGDMTVLKPPGFWGQHAEASPEPATVGEGVAGEWPTFRRTATNGGATDEAVGPGGDGRERWTADLDGGIRGGLAAAPTHGLLYTVTGSATVAALGVDSGETAWTAGVDFSYGTGDAAVPPSPVVDTGTVYVGARFVKAFDATTGEERWSADAGDRVRATPALRSNTLYVPTSGDSVVALDTATGERRWRVTLGDGPTPLERVDGTSTGMTAAKPGTPAVADGRVYVGSSRGVHAFDALSQAVDWETETPPVRSPPAVLDDWLWAGTDAGVVALGAPSGERHWTASLDDPVVAAPVVDPVVSRVYAATLGGDAVAFDASTGEAAWTAALDRRVLASPALADGTLYVGHAGGTVVALDGETGAVLGEYDTTGQLYASPVVHGSSLYYGSGTGAVYAVDAETAERESAHPAHGD
jgi:outer membrane protein assembly factor BamB/ferredoxin